MRLKAFLVALFLLLCLTEAGKVARAMPAASDSETVTLYVRGQDGVSEGELLAALAEVSPVKTTVLSDGSVEVVLSLKGTSQSQLRERISRLNGVMQVGEMNLAEPTEPTAGVTVPGLDDTTAATIPAPTVVPRERLGRTGAWWVLGGVGIVCAVGGGFILLDDVRRRYQRRQLEAAFEEEPPSA
jgi:hypothetical protein